MLSPKPFASLSSSLLARKGAARPAMRPQSFVGLTAAPREMEDLGWNDMGDDAAPPQAPMAEAEKPAVLVAREALEQSVTAPAPAPETPQAVRPVSVATATRLSRETAHAGRAAFTLRLDADRHLKLRLASALSNRSSQQLVGIALDQMLADMPEIDALIAQLPPQRLGRARGKRA